MEAKRRSQSAPKKPDSIVREMAFLLNRLQWIGDESAGLGLQYARCGYCEQKSAPVDRNDFYKLDMKGRSQLIQHDPRCTILAVNAFFERAPELERLAWTESLRAQTPSGIHDQQIERDQQPALERAHAALKAAALPATDTADENQDAGRAA